MITAERGVIPSLAVTGCGTEDVAPRSGMCVRFDQVTTGAWWQSDDAPGKLLQPWGVAIAPGGVKAVVSDARSSILFEVEIATGVVSEFAGAVANKARNTFRGGGLYDGAGTEALFFHPRGVAFSPDGGTVYVADSANNVIRAVSYPGGEVTTLAGNVKKGVGLAGLNDGALRVAKFSEPHDVAVSPPHPNPRPHALNLQA